jgi:aryl-alcohol dehydrogenase-like predicted oxidoreductase
MAVIPRERESIIDNWNVNGLRGTGSHDMAVDDVVMPEDRTFIRRADRGRAAARPPAGHSPLGHGFLTGEIRSPEQLSDDDWRKTNPRFTGENFQRNLRVVDEVRAVAREVGATPAQIALAWLLAQGDDIAPIPGTKRVARVEENTAADGIELSAKQVERLNHLTPASGERHDQGNMAVIDR